MKRKTYTTQLQILKHLSGKDALTWVGPYIYLN